MLRSNTFTSVANERQLRLLSAVRTNTFTAQKSPSIKSTSATGSLGDIAYNTQDDNYYGYTTVGWTLLSFVSPPPPPPQSLQDILQVGNTTGNTDIIFPSNQPPSTTIGMLRITTFTGVPTGNPGGSGQLAYFGGYIYVHTGGGVWKQLPLESGLSDVLSENNHTGDFDIVVDAGDNILLPNNQSASSTGGFLKVTTLNGAPTGDPGTIGQLAYYSNSLYIHTGSGTWIQLTPEQVITLDDATPSGHSLIVDSVGPNLTVKTLQAGNNVTITDTGNELEISAAGGGGGSPTAVTGFARSPNASPGAITFDWKIVEYNKLISFTGFISIFSGGMGSSQYQWFVDGMPAPAAAYGGLVQFICHYNVDNNAGAPGGTFPGNYGDLTIQNDGNMVFSGNGVNPFTDTSGSNALYVQGSYFVD